MPEDRFFQEYMADFRKQEGLVYKEFGRTLHIYDNEAIDVVMKIGSVDFGFVNPCAVLTVLKDKRGTYWVANEFYETGKTDAQIAEVVAAKEFTKVYPDPENQGAIKELRDRNVNVQEVLKDKGSVIAGIQKIRELLKQRRIRIHRSCLNLIWELETYHYPKSKVEGNDSEVPVKENDHALDALRYVILMDATIEEVKQYQGYLARVSNPKSRINPAR
jgi:phage terminase large subunit